MAKDKEGAQEDSGEACTVGGLEVEGGPVLAPPPITTILDLCQEPPPFFHLEQLALVFELRSQMADQIHRDILMHQCIDMLYEAYSNAPAGQKCPTCARPFVLQPRNGPLSGDPSDATSMQMGNSVAWISVRLLALLQRSFNFMFRSLFNLFNFQFNFQFSLHGCSEQWCTDSSLPPALVSVWQGRWRTANFDNDITVCHLFRFLLIRRNNWQTVAMCFFVLKKF
jgi:hypothetical protein